jgi:hypothetical protein
MPQAISNTAETRFLSIFRNGVSCALVSRPRQRTSRSWGPGAPNEIGVCPFVSQNVHIDFQSDLIDFDVNVMKSDDVSLVLMIQAKVQVVVAT